MATDRDDKRALAAHAQNESRAAAATRIQAQISSMMARGEQEFLRGLLSKKTNYRLIISGEVGLREINNLIKILEAQRTVFQEEDQETDSIDS